MTACPPIPPGELRDRIEALRAAAERRATQWNELAQSATDPEVAQDYRALSAIDARSARGFGQALDPVRARDGS